MCGGFELDLILICIVMRHFGSLAFPLSVWKQSKPRGKYYDIKNSSTELDKTRWTLGVKASFQWRSWSFHMCLIDITLFWVLLNLSFSCDHMFLLRIGCLLNILKLNSVIHWFSSTLSETHRCRLQSLNVDKWGLWISPTWVEYVFSRAYHIWVILCESSVRKALNTLIIFWQLFVVPWQTTAMEILCPLCSFNWQILSDLNFYCSSTPHHHVDGWIEWLLLSCRVIFLKGLHSVADLKESKALKHITCAVCHLGVCHDSIRLQFDYLMIITIWTIITIIKIIMIFDASSLSGLV